MTIPVNSGGESAAPYFTMSDKIPQGDGVFKDPEKFDKDEEDEVMSISPSIANSVMTADGIHDVNGFAVVFLVILVGDMARGVFFPTMWPLVSELGGSTVSLGYTVASFSFGRILVSPMFGRWSVTYGYSKTLLFSCSILWFGTLL